MIKKMKIFLNILILLFIPSVGGNHDIKWNKKAKIISGMRAQPGQFPFVASIMRKAGFGQKCGGSVLNKYFILTACHCVAQVKHDEIIPQELSWLLVVAGHVNRLPGQGGQVRFLDAAIIHEKCELIFPGATYDLALARVTQPFHWTPWLKPMPLISRDPQVFEKTLKHLMSVGAECYGVGWGMTEISDTIKEKYITPSEHLLYAKVNLLDLENCESISPLELDRRRQICALGTEGRDVCKADSGGPLVCLGNVYAIVSWGPFCGEYTMSTMYQRVDSDLNFINSVLL